MEIGHESWVINHGLVVTEGSNDALVRPHLLSFESSWLSVLSGSPTGVVTCVL